MESFATRLKKLRQLNRMKQSDMAMLLKVTTRHYQDIEYGKIDLPTSKLVNLAERFNVSIDYLTGRSDCPDMLTYDKEGNPIIIEAMAPPKK